MNELSNFLDALAAVLGAIATIKLLYSDDRYKAIALYVAANALMALRTYVEIQVGSPSIFNIICLSVSLIVGMHGLPELIIIMMPTIRTIVKATLLILGFAAAMYLAVLHDNYVSEQHNYQQEVGDVVRNY